MGRPTLLADLGRGGRLPRQTAGASRLAVRQPVPIEGLEIGGRRTHLGGSHRARVAGILDCGNAAYSRRRAHVSGCFNKTYSANFDAIWHSNIGSAIGVYYEAMFDGRLQ